jgi:hypothetical protein
METLVTVISSEDPRPNILEVSACSIGIARSGDIVVHALKRKEKAEIQIIFFMILTPDC